MDAVFAARELIPAFVMAVFSWYNASSHDLICSYFLSFFSRRAGEVFRWRPFIITLNLRGGRKPGGSV